jgi:hypothetical protein
VAAVSQATAERSGAVPAELDSLAPAVAPPTLDPGVEDEAALQAMLGNGALAGTMPPAALEGRPPAAETMPPAALEGRPPATETTPGVGLERPPPATKPLAASVHAVLVSLLGDPAAELQMISDAAHDAELAADRAPAAVSGGAIVLPTGQTVPATDAAARALLAAARNALAGVEGPIDPAAPVPPPGYEEFVEVADEAAPEPGAKIAPEEPSAPAPEEKPAVAVEAPAPEAEAPVAVEAPPVPSAPVAGRPGFELLMPPAPSAPSAAQVERMEQAKDRAGAASRSAAKLPSARTTTKEARAAVEEPKEEIAAHARAALATALGKNPPPNPAIVELCTEIRAAIKARRPVKEKDLTKADMKGVAKEVGHTLDGTVDANVEGVRKGYGALEHPPEGKAKQEPTPLGPPPPPLGEPKIGADAAVPDPIPPESLSLEHDQKQVAERVQESGINRPTTEVITDPPFSTVREGQAELDQLAKESAAQLAAKQQQRIADAQASMAELQARAVEALRESRSQTVGSVGGRKKKMVGTEEEKRAAFSKPALKIFNDTQKRVNEIVTPLPGRAKDLWRARVEAASEEFKTTLAGVQSWIDDRHSGFTGWFAEKWDDWTGLPGWVTKDYNEAEQRFGDLICKALEEISADVDRTIAAAQALIVEARTGIDDIFTKDVPPELEKWASAERERFHAQLDGLSKRALATRDTFVADVSREAIAAVTEVQQQVEELREKAKGKIRRIAEAIEEFIDDPVRAIINGLLNLVGIPPKSFWDLVEKIEQAIDDIADDPIGFLNNLMEGLSQGFSGFFDRFPKHLLQGFWDWLFSGLGSVGVKLPSDLSPMSLVTFCLQLMGITWPRIRDILVKHIGEDNIALIERAWELVSTLIELGPEGVVAMIKEKLDPKTILDQILKAAIDYMVEAIVKSVAKRLLLLFNPAGAIIQAIELIYRIGKWIFQNAVKIFRLVETVVNGIVDIIAGNVAGFAKSVEGALASLVPVVIDFIADYFGLGDLPIKIADLIKQLQEFVLKIIDELIGTIVEKAKELLASLLGDEEEEEKEGAVDEELGRDVGFSAAGEHHHQWIALEGTEAVPMVASAEGKVFDKLTAWDTTAPMLPTPEAQEKAKALVGDALGALGKVVNLANSLAEDYAAHSKGDPLPDDSELEAAQGELSAKLRELMDIFEPGADPEVVFAAQIDRVHERARPVVVAALKAIKPLAEKWDQAQTEATKLAPFAYVFKRPLNQDSEFGADAHVWATMATMEGVNSALTAYPTTSKADEASRVEGVRRDLFRRGLLTGGLVAKDGAAEYLNRFKPSIYDGVPPFEPAGEAIRETIWVATHQGDAEVRITAAFDQRVQMGGPPPQPPLPPVVRERILAKLKGAPLSVTSRGEEIVVALDSKLRNEIENDLRKESEDAKYDPVWKKMLLWWADNLFQEEFHHTWPEWLGGPSLQTRMILPKALHHFETLAGNEFPGGFHQIFNELFRATFAVQIADGELAVNNPDLWAAWVKTSPESLVVVGRLLRRSYLKLFAGFTGANEDALKQFIAVLVQQLPEEAS